MIIDPQELISNDQTAEQLNVKPQTLASWRALGRGPHFVKIGRAVFYRREDIAGWLGQQRRQPVAAAREQAAAEAEG